jgi:hypothetical protein
MANDPIARRIGNRLPLHGEGAAILAELAFMKLLSLSIRSLCKLASPSKVASWMIRLFLLASLIAASPVANQCYGHSNPYGFMHRLDSCLLSTPPN